MSTGREYVVKHTSNGYEAGWSRDLRGDIEKSYGRFDCENLQDERFRNIVRAANERADRLNWDVVLKPKAVQQIPVAKPKPTDIQRLLASIQYVGDYDCLHLIGSDILAHRYFMLNSGAVVLASAFMWESHHGPIPRDRKLENTCWTPKCVNHQHHHLVLKRRSFIS